MVLIGHAKLGPLLGKTQAPFVFQTAVRIAQSVPVYQLCVVRNHDRLGAVVSTVRGWHNGGTLAPTR
jgi:hypothetical protein